jgi:hypothetical protein
MRPGILSLRAAAPLILAVLAAGCGPTTITSSQSTVTTDDIQADVPVRITAAKFVPSTLHLFEGLVATFVNEDTVARTIGVDAVHSDQAGCAAVAMTLQPGERRATPPLPHFAACFFNDGQRPTDKVFQGVVVTH